MQSYSKHELIEQVMSNSAMVYLTLKDYHVPKNLNMCSSRPSPFLVCWRTEGGGVATFIASP